MRQHICKQCGKIYLTDKPGSTVCPECAKAIRKDVSCAKICAICGKEFVGYPRSKYCTQCKPIARREAGKRWRKSGTVRPIGSIDLCASCGKPYTVTGSLQRYCPGCAKTVVTQNIRAAKKKYHAENAEAINAAKSERRKDRRVCAICGNVFSSMTPTVTCSPECAAELKRQRQARADAKRGKADPARIFGKKEHTAPRSGIPGITWCRGKWQLTYRGKYIGLFETAEAAADRLHELKDAETEEQQ